MEVDVHIWHACSTTYMFPNNKEKVEKKYFRAQKISMKILDYTCRARWPFRAFAQESLKTVTSPTSYRKYPQKGPNLGLPRDAHFWFTFISIEIKLHLVSRGTPLFPLLFTLDWVFKSNIAHFRVQKVVQTDGDGLTDARTDRRTSKI